MNKLDQSKTPYVDALKKYIDEENIPFDVPGHHQRNIKTNFSEIFSSKIYKGDVNAPRGLDNVAHPTGVLKEAEELMADVTHAKYAKFLVNGSTIGIQVMIMSAVKSNEKIILPRNCHKSVISALILSGAVPVFVMPNIDKSSEIVNQVSFENWKKAIDENPDAKAIFVINPTYFGATCELKKVVDYAHSKNMLVLCDEAHGTHFYFGKNLPITAMDAGADLSTLSFHKTGGSLTQSSVLLIGTDKIPLYKINKVYLFFTSTSPNTLLIASMDAARSYLYLNGEKKINKAIRIANYARKEIAKIDGFIPLNPKRFRDNGAYNYDKTKVAVELDNLTINGFELYKILHDEYHIQLELAETYVFLLIISFASKKSDIDALLEALKDISIRFYDKNLVIKDHKFSKSFPELEVRPRVAFHAPLRKVPLDEAINKISKDMIMIYPPGIPVIIPGEKFTENIIESIKNYQKNNITIISDYDDGDVSIIDEVEWEKEDIPNYEDE